MLAEMPLSRALHAVDDRTIDGDMLIATHVERFAFSAEVDGVTSPAGRFAAHRAVTATDSGMIL